MAANEVAARQHAGHFAYFSEERSERTGGHLWRERVVEVGDGVLRCLIAVDGTPLAPPQVAAEQKRLLELVVKPDEFRRLAQAHKDDEVHATRLLELLPKAFVITQDGKQGECQRYRFVPNANFHPATYEERVGAAMAGTISVMEPVQRLCTLEATVQYPVTFGFGLIGKVEQGSNFRLERVRVTGGEWKTQFISVHLGGKILLAKSLTKQQETLRSDLRLVPENLTLGQGLAMLTP
jgi:hypothetical protein